MDVAGTGAVGTITGAHFVTTPLPKHFQFDGDSHFVFDHPEVFDFRGDFTVTLLIRPPTNLEAFHVLLSRRGSSDYNMHHSIFVDTRSSWVGTWTAGEPVAVMHMGAGAGSGRGMNDGDASDSVWAYTDTFAVGDWLQLTFTVRAGRICGFVNGARSGDCSATLLDSDRQMGTGEPLEVGGEESYTNHPLWSMASLAYYDRALSEDEVMFNYAASECLERGARCP